MNQEHLTKVVELLKLNQAAAAAAPPPILGRVTELRCSCGCFLHEVVPDLSILSKMFERTRPQHRQKRILKKRLKVWEKHLRMKLALTKFMVRPSYVCGTCGKRASVYSAVAQNMFTVEPMPPGALPFYLK